PRHGPPGQARGVTATRNQTLAARRDVSSCLGAHSLVAERRLHLPHGWLETPPAIPPGWRLSAACRSREALARAEAVGVEVVFVSPVFFPGGRSGARPGMTPLGREGLAALVRSTRLPVIALGGLDAARILTLRGSGARGAAAVEAVQAAFGDQAVRP
ncbi:MAG: thiamine phosphate synthase, partial [Brevundimonas sp.]|uniref:thiamine phosphate synthase n=1 Tax=Brevundimonas sp. TaxID=1871086 RepID=UPI00391D4EBD